MGNLIRMDLYRMAKSTAFRACAIIAFVLSAAQTPLSWGMTFLARLIGDQGTSLPATAPLSSILSAPLPFLNSMLVLLSAGSFFYADVENGYIKNIAGQMPKRGFTVLSKYFAIIPHNLLFMLLGVAGNLLGTVFFQRIVGGNELHSLLVFLMKFLLIQSLCTVMLLVTAAFRNKSLGSVLAVLLGTGLMELAYIAISSGISQVLGLQDFSLGRYMPDQLLGTADPEPLRAFLASAATTAIFLPLSIHVFDRRDVK